MAKYLSIDDGGLVECEAVASSAGSADAGKIPALDEDGRLDPSIATSFSPRGAWVPGYSYTVNDIVTDGGETFRAKETHSGSSTSPSGDTTNWEKWAAKGVGFNPRGTWSSSTFAVNDIVVYHGATFRAKTAHETETNPVPPADTTNWEPWALGLNPVGAWTDNTTYAKNDVVTDGGETFRAKTTHTGSYTAPASDTDNWERLATKGEDGEDGEDGDATAYSPADSGDWDGTAPTTIAEALDRCAELLKTLNSGTGP